jgi:hypothetical protein
LDRLVAIEPCVLAAVAFDHALLRNARRAQGMRLVPYAACWRAMGLRLVPANFAPSTRTRASVPYVA